MDESDIRAHARAWINMAKKALKRLAVVSGVLVTIGSGVIITFAWMALLVRGFAALISWAI